ncbi:MAG TPA: hypothetical protein VHW45_11370 [Candidatus Sulfotelmatobacter sp.]|jgi:hypothetical protein|nr:hypothetical protein [Candidatus Sulfotelmatobacter sp.]
MAVRKLDLSLPDSRKDVALKNDPTRIDPRKLKLGKQMARHDPRTLLLASYTTTALPNPPDTFNLAGKITSWGMMENDQIGDCTCAAAGHLLMEWTANAGKKMFTPTDKQIVAAYSAITGYNPTTGANDNGAVEIDVLNYWRQSGIAGHKIGAYVALEPSNHIHVMDSVYIFEGCYIGLQLPISAQAQVQNHQPWSVPPGGPTGNGKPGSWGGHAIPVVAYDSRGVTVVTWGALQVMTWSFWETYCEEAYAIVSNDYLTGKKTTPQGFNMTQLVADLADLK